MAEHMETDDFFNSFGGAHAASHQPPPPAAPTMYMDTAGSGADLLAAAVLGVPPGAALLGATLGNGGSNGGLAELAASGLPPRPRPSPVTHSRSRSDNLTASAASAEAAFMFKGLTVATTGERLLSTRSAPNSAASDSLSNDSLRGSGHKPSSVPNSPKSSPSRKSRRRKDNKQHNEEEFRRRARIRERFLELRLVTSCHKKDRYSILAASIDKLKDVRARIERMEAERQQLQARLQNAGGSAHGAGQAVGVATASPRTGLTYHIPMALTTLDGYFVNCNDLFLRLTGLRKDELLQRSIFSLTHHEHLTDACAMVQLLLASTGQQQPAVYDHDSLWLRADGSQLRVHMTVSCVVRTLQEQQLLSYFMYFVTPKVSLSGANLMKPPLSGGGPVNTQQHFQQMQMLQQQLRHHLSSPIQSSPEGAELSEATTDYDEQ